MKTKVLKRILIIFASLIAIIMAVIGFFAIKGAVMWNDAKERLPIEQTLTQMLSDENFVRYGELPEFYINAVISTEDRKFEKHNGVNFK